MEDCLPVSFDEIRQYGTGSRQVARRPRAALARLASRTTTPARRKAVPGYLGHLHLGVGRSTFDDRDQASAREEDRQGLEPSRNQDEVRP
jgi:hypothetical protein